MPSLQRCVSKLCDLIAHSTVNPGGDEEGMCRALAQDLRDLGADSVSVSLFERENSSLGAYVYACFGKPTLLFNVHIDTVPPNNGWKRDPFVAEVTDYRVYGLGSCDIKGAVAALLVALETTSPHNIGVLFSGDEENGSRSVPRFLANTDTSKITRAIVCEPTSRCAGISHRGITAYRARYQGSGGHSSQADAMEKPLVELSRLALQLDAIAQAALGSGPKGMQGLCMNVAQMSGGVAYNVVPDSAELRFSVRPPPGFDADAFAAQLEAARLASHAKIEIHRDSQHHPFACAAPESMRALLGSSTEQFVGLDFWTEAALLQEAGIDSIVIGPGDISQAHSSDEFVMLDDLRWALDLFEGAIRSHAP